MRKNLSALLIALSLCVALALPVAVAAQDIAAQNHKAKYHHYQLIDVGTFGGPQRGLYVPHSSKRPNSALTTPFVAGSFSWPVALHDR